LKIIIPIPQRVEEVDKNLDEVKAWIFRETSP